MYLDNVYLYYLHASTFMLKGFKTITVNDLSRVALNQLKIRYESKYPSMEFFQGNMTDTNLPENSFQTIIDKALFDALLCGTVGRLTISQYIFEVIPLINCKWYIYMSQIVCAVIGSSITNWYRCIHFDFTWQPWNQTAISWAIWPRWAQLHSLVHRSVRIHCIWIE